MFTTGSIAFSVGELYIGLVFGSIQERANILLHGSDLRCSFRFSDMRRSEVVG